MGSTTWRRQELAKGLEADKCYYIQNEAVIRGRDEIDLAIDPPPDLAIEINNTRSSLNRLDIYARLGIPEVWRFDGTSLTIYRLIDGEYIAQERSMVLPLLKREDILQLLQKSQTMGETSWVKSVRQWVRTEIDRGS
ncbi:MAG: Uma2 family endonuclease [Cyanobacteria bacterium P01_F01_bin.150]